MRCCCLKLPSCRSSVPATLAAPSRSPTPKPFRICTPLPPPPPRPPIGQEPLSTLPSKRAPNPTETPRPAAAAMPPWVPARPPHGHPALRLGIAGWRHHLFLLQSHPPSLRLAGLARSACSQAGGQRRGGPVPSCPSVSHQQWLLPSLAAFGASGTSLSPSRPHGTPSSEACGLPGSGNPMCPFMLSQGSGRGAGGPPRRGCSSQLVFGVRRLV